CWYNQIDAGLERTELRLLEGVSKDREMDGGSPLVSASVAPTINAASASIAGVNRVFTLH
ncbi:MAG TPA: hypothetical protein VJT54_03510, partial [Verrucomicrobiae bacterium]|nr:hypothetical protein [Verrucomicrobiae bacterium]